MIAMRTHSSVCNDTLSHFTILWDDVHHQNRLYIFCCLILSSVIVLDSRRIFTDYRLLCDWLIKIIWTDDLLSSTSEFGSVTGALPSYEAGVYEGLVLTKVIS
jgi:hypothetical protein